jgi:flagellar motility protein MotE (MotC chaperone)
VSSLKNKITWLERKLSEYEAKEAAGAYQPAVLARVSSSMEGVPRTSTATNDDTNTTNIQQAPIPVELEAITDELKALRAELVLATAAKDEAETSLSTIDDRYSAATEELHRKLKKEQESRKAILNKLIEVQGNIRVFCRVRPLNKMEVEGGYDNVVTVWSLFFYLSK